MLSTLPNPHLAALIHSYWYYVAMLAKTGNTLDRVNLINLIEKVRARIERETGQS